MSDAKLVRAVLAPIMFGLVYTITEAAPALAWFEWFFLVLMLALLGAILLLVTHE